MRPSWRAGDSITASVLQHRDEFSHQLIANLRVRHLPCATIDHGDADFVPFLEQPLHIPRFRLKIVLVNQDTGDADFLDILLFWFLRASRSRRL